MGSVQENTNGDCIENTSVEQLLSPDSADDSADVYSVFGDPEIHPRVGEQYQAEIPSLISKSQHHLYKKSPFELNSKPLIPSDFLIGLSIPIMHINKVDLENGLVSFKSAKEKKAYKKHLSKGYCLLPGLGDGSWTEIEEGCFLLGLYSFGKDLVLVKKFVEEKSMGDLQSYYYGQFYKTNEYRRWSDCRKVRSRKCVYGHKLFSGMRQQELLSRLFQHLSEELQISLSQASKSYNDGQLSLNEYVFALKAIVGAKHFVKAVAIGKGKRDLTSITMEPPRANQIAPSGKACSSLTSQEITKLLTGGSRLSKTKSNDLFWEAIWPRLLARGWHSEQPKDQIYSFGTKGSLVFLTPGVKKFSRRKLVKGEHYLDCVSDVLNKVALDPSLLELESEGVENNENKVEDGWSKETTPENDDMANQMRHRYLQPRTPNRDRVMKFTIVDTSMTCGKVFKIRELRMVGDKLMNPSILSENSDDNGSEDLSQDSYIEDCANSTKYIKRSPPICSLFQEKVTETESAIENSNDPDFVYKIPKRVREDHDLGEEKRPKKSPKYCRGSKKADKKYLSPVVAKKSRKLSSCTQVTKASDSSEKSQIDSLSKDSSFEGSQGFACENNICSDGLSNKSQFRRLIDLNLPQVSPECEIGEDLATESINEKGDQTLPEFYNGEVLATGSKDKKADEMKKAENFIGPKQTPEIISSDQQANNNSRRQGTRNRPPTLRALEALASGFLTVNTRKKKQQTDPGKTSSSRPRHSSSGGMEGTEDLGNNGSEDTNMTDLENVESNCDSGKFGKLHVFPDGNADKDLC